MTCFLNLFFLYTLLYYIYVARLKKQKKTTKKTTNYELAFKQFYVVVYVNITLRCVLVLIGADMRMS